MIKNIPMTFEQAYCYLCKAIDVIALPLFYFGPKTKKAA